jgi:hypothetical protein
MFSRHYTKDLSAYCHGKLAEDKSRAVARHLAGCDRCRRELEQIKLGIKLAEQLTVVAAPDSLWDGIERLLEKQQKGGRRQKGRGGLSPAIAWKPIAIGASALAVALTVALVWLVLSRSAAPWPVLQLEPGVVTIDDETIPGTGEIGVGEVLETDSTARARVGVSILGQVELDPNSRLQLLEAKPQESRLFLGRGRLHASISAPPRFFFVNTPSAIAVDLGCKYTLEVYETGNGLISVAEGWVEMVREGVVSTVPAGAACQTYVGSGPGTPYFEDASNELKSALWELDFGSAKDPESLLTTILAESRRRDSLTLWHLLFRVNDAERERVYDRLVEMVPPPPNVGREHALSLDKEKLEDWWPFVIRSWF